MARRTPPNYPIDGEAIFIPEDDSAWDHDRIAREREEYEARDATHPVDEYLTGKTRCRLTPDIESYLDMSKDPEMWVLKEPSPAAKRKIDAYVLQTMRLVNDGRDMLDAEVQLSRHLANLAAFQNGVARVDNWGFEKFHFRLDSHGSIPDPITNMIEAVAPGLSYEIGQAVMLAFRPLDTGGAEGK